MKAITTHLPSLPGLVLMLAMATAFSCNSGNDSGGGDKTVSARTPVTVVHPETGDISDYLELNATSTFLRKETLKSTANGYIADIKISIGEKVHKGEVLFVIQTKESKALGGAGSLPDSSLRFNGLISVRAARDGLISTLSHQKGDYVQDGDPLAVIAEASSLVFMVDAPYEYHKYLLINKKCAILLPDGGKISGIIRSGLPVMDLGSQTQNYIVDPDGNTAIPEGLIARVRILKTDKPRAQLLPREAILSDEKEMNFWVMKLINDSTAVKVPVTTGLQDDDKQEITAPQFSPDDRIVITGNYGLDDTASVKITR